MPSRKPAQMTVNQLFMALSKLVKEGHGTKPVMLYSDQEGNEVNGVHQLELFTDCLCIIPKHWSQQ